MLKTGWNQSWVGGYYEWSDDTDLWSDGQEFVMTTDHVCPHIQWHVAQAPCDNSYDLEFPAGRAIGNRTTGMNVRMIKSLCPCVCYVCKMFFNNYFIKYNYLLFNIKTRTCKYNIKLLEFNIALNSYWYILVPFFNLLWSLYLIFTYKQFLIWKVFGQYHI